MNSYIYLLFLIGVGGWPSLMPHLHHIDVGLLFQGVLCLICMGFWS